MTSSNSSKPNYLDVEEPCHSLVLKAKVWRFSLWKLLVVFVGFAISLGMLGLEIQLAKQDSQIVQTLNQFGPNCSYVDDSIFFFGSLTQRVAHLSFKLGGKLNDESLVELKGLTALRDLNLVGSSISDAGLEHLKELSNLFCLDLSKTQITDAGLVHLKGLTELKILDLENTQITNVGVAYLKDLTNLHSLDITNTQVTEIGVKNLRHALPNCKIFGIAFLSG